MDSYMRHYLVKSMEIYKMLHVSFRAQQQASHQKGFQCQAPNSLFLASE